jgi:hypothetical protein
MAGSTQLAGAPRGYADEPPTGRSPTTGEQNYIVGLEEWMRQNPDLMERSQSELVDPNMVLDLDQPSPWSLRNVQPTQPISDIDRAAFLRAFSI